MSEDRLAHLRLMLGMLARNEEPYGGGPFDAHYMEIDQADAQVLSGALDELETYRSSVTTGGPPAPITEGWTPGDSSRPPTAPPEELVVALPISDEELGELRYRTCEDCGRSHPAWISCEVERDVLAVDHVDEPPPR